MDIYAQKDNKETFANVEIVVPGDDEDETESDNVKLLTGLERSYAIDTAALLGGNEYLIKQMLDEIEQLEYNEKELSVLKWALTELWGENAANKVFQNDGKEIRNQKDLNKLFTKDNQARLPRTLSSSLLYCGRYDDTKIYSDPMDHMQRFFFINLNNFAYMNLPVGNIPDNSDTSKMIECEKLAVVYFKLTNDAPSPYTFGTRKKSAAGMAENDQPEGTQRRRYLAPGRPRERQLSESQKLSESLALEKGMLSRLHFVGIVPVP